VQTPTTSSSEGFQPNLITANIVFDHLTVAGYGRGIVVPRWGNNTIDGGTFNNTYDIVIRNAVMLPRTLEIKNLQTLTPTIIMTPDFNPPLEFGNSADLFFVSDVITLNFGVFVGKRLYSDAQKGDFKPFPLNSPGIEDQYENKSNLELMAQYQKAIGGQIAPSLPGTFQLLPYILDGLVSL
jgi:hypothetical protein